MKRNWPQKSALLFRFLKCPILKCAQLNSIQPMESAQNRLESKDWLEDKPSCSHPPRFLQGCNAPPLTGHCSGAGSGASERCRGERWCRATAGLSRCCDRHQLSATEAVHAGRGSVTRQPRPVKGAAAQPILPFSDKVPAPRHPLSQIRDPNMERLAGTYQPTHPPPCLHS